MSMSSIFIRTYRFPAHGKGLSAAMAAWANRADSPLIFTPKRCGFRRSRGKRPCPCLPVTPLHIESPVPITPERFRTTVATDLYEQTGDLKLLQAAGGWTTAAVPLKYYAKGRSTTQAASIAIQAVYGVPQPVS